MGSCLELAPADQRRREGRVRNGSARITLLSDSPRLNGALAREVGVSLPTVHRWQRRVQEHGVDGLLRDKTGPLRIPTLTPEAVVTGP